MLPWPRLLLLCLAVVLAGTLTAWLSAPPGRRARRGAGGEGGLVRGDLSVVIDQVKQLKSSLRATICACSNFSTTKRRMVQTSSAGDWMS